MTGERQGNERQLFDVNTLKHAIFVIQRELTKNPVFLQNKIEVGVHAQRRCSSHCSG